MQQRLLPADRLAPFACASATIKDKKQPSAKPPAIRSAAQFFVKHGLLGRLDHSRQQRTDFGARDAAAESVVLNNRHAFAAGADVALFVCAALRTRPFTFGTNNSRPCSPVIYCWPAVTGPPDAIGRITGRKLVVGAESPSAPVIPDTRRCTTRMRKSSFITLTP